MFLNALCLGVSVMLLLGFLPLLCMSASSSSLRPPTRIRTDNSKSKARPTLPKFPLGKSPLSTLAPAHLSSKQRSTTSLSSSSSSSDSFLNWTLSCVTWNLQEMTPSLEDCKFLRSFSRKDLVVVGVQECEHLRPRRQEGRRSRALRQQLDTTLGSTHTRKAIHKMGGVQIFLYMKKSITEEVQGLQLIGVPCGTGNVLTNKGAVCLLLRARDHTFAFINAHLAAHEPKLKERNANYHRIRDSILSRADEIFLPPVRSGGVRRTAGSVAAPIPLATPSGSESESVSASVVSVSRSNNLYLERLLTASGMPRDKVLMPFISDSSSSGNDELGQSFPAYEHTVVNEKNAYDIGMNRESTLNHRMTDLSSSFSEREKDEWPFDAVFFFGDLNYRIKGMSRGQMDKFISHVRTIEKKQLKLKTKDVKKKTNIPPPKPSILQLSSKKKSSTKAKAIIDMMKVSQKSLPLLTQVLRFDQLTEEKKRRRSFSGFQEGPISFLPTYKYDQRSCSFDSSEKRRCPSWTDRVLYKDRASDRGDRSSSRRVKGGELLASIFRKSKQQTSSKGAQQQQKRDSSSSSSSAAAAVRVQLDEYCSFDVRHSDHRPVAATFSLKERES